MKNASKEALVVDLFKSKWNKQDLTLRDILMKLYVEDGLSQRQIKEELHVGVGTVNDWMHKEKIPARKMKWTY